MVIAVEKDYQKLCLELFGTDEEDRMREIAEKVSRKNPRNAGRKKRFRPEEVAQMQKLREGGAALSEIAGQFGTSRQMIGKLLSSAPREGCSLRMTYMYGQHPCTVIDVDFLNRKIYIQNHTGDLLHRAFGVKEEPTWEDFEDFLEERCFPRTRGDCRKLLEKLDLTDYDPLQIIEKTRGRMAEDSLWIKLRYLEKKGDASRA